MNKALLIAFVSATFWLSTAEAMSVTSSTIEELSFWSCYPPACHHPSRVYGGSPGGSTASASGSTPGIGFGSGSVSLSGTIGAPIMRSASASIVGTRVNSFATALQSYTYTGTQVTTRIFGGALTYSQTVGSAVTVDDITFVGGVEATIDIFTLPSHSVDVGATQAESFIIMATEQFSGLSALGRQQFTDFNSTTNGVATLGVSVIFHPGETVWVWTQLSTFGENGSSIDASHTFVTSWDNSVDLRPAAAIPEPTTSALFVGGLIVLLLRRRPLTSRVAI